MVLSRRTLLPHYTNVNWFGRKQPQQLLYQQGLHQRLSLSGIVQKINVYPYFVTPS